MIELTVKKIFEELIIKEQKVGQRIIEKKVRSCGVEYRRDWKSLVVKYDYDLGYDIVSFIGLIKDGVMIIQYDGIDIEYDQFRVQADQRY